MKWLFGFEHVDFGVGSGICGVRLSLILVFIFIFLFALALFYITVIGIDRDDEGIRLVIPRLSMTLTRSRDIRIFGGGSGES